MKTQRIIWSGSLSNTSSIVISEYVEKNSLEFRDQYLRLVYQLSQSVVLDESLYRALQLSKGVNLWWMSLIVEKSFFKSILMQECIKLLAFEKVLTENPHREIEIIGVVDSRIKKAIAKFCNQQSIQVRFVDAEVRMFPVQRKKINKLPHCFQAISWFFFHTIFRLSLKVKKHFVWWAGKDTVFFFSYFIHLNYQKAKSGIFYSFQWGDLPEKLSVWKINQNWVHQLVFNKEIRCANKAMELIDLFNKDREKQGVHNLLNSYITPLMIVKVLYQWAKVMFQRYKFRRIKKSLCSVGCKMDLWGVLKEDLLSSLYGKVALQNILLTELIDAAVGSLPKQKVGLYLYEGQGWERAFIYCWKKYGHGDLIGVAHSTIRFWDLRYFHDRRTITDKHEKKLPQPDKIAVNGPVAWNLLVDSCYPSDNLVEVEALRYINYRRRHSEQQVHEKKLNNNKLRLLVLGDISPDLNSALIGLLSSLPEKVLSGLDITVKPHPGASIDKHHSRLVYTLISDPLDKVLNNFNVVLGLNPSSANLDAYMAGLPVIIYFESGDLIFSPLREQNDVFFVADRDSLISALNEAGDIDCREQHDYFWLEPSLPKWHSFLNSYQYAP